MTHSAFVCARLLPLHGLRSFLSSTSKSPYRTLNDLLAGSPGEAWRTTRIASAGPASSTPYSQLKSLKRMADAKINYVPLSRIGAPRSECTTRPARGCCSMASYPNVTEQMKAGISCVHLRWRLPTRIRANFAISQPSLNLDIEILSQRFGLASIVPANTPNEIVFQLAAWFSAAPQVPRNHDEA